MSTTYHSYYTKSLTSDHESRISLQNIGRAVKLTSFVVSGSLHMDCLGGGGALRSSKVNMPGNAFSDISRYHQTRNLFFFQALKWGKSTFSKLEMRIFVAFMYYLKVVFPVELRCEFLLPLITGTNHQEYMILPIFGWKMSQQVAPRSVSSKGAEALLLTPPLIGLHSKVPNQEFITERQVLVFLQLEQNAIGWLFLRYHYMLRLFSCKAHLTVSMKSSLILHALFPNLVSKHL